jgi:hypothetical protein
VLAGYLTFRNRLKHGMDCDIYAELRAGLTTTRVVVECKNKRHSAAADVSDVSKFSGLFLSLRSQNLVDQALFVTNSSLSPQAHECATKAGVHALTYRELLNRLVDFSTYVDRLVHDYENFQEYCDGQRAPVIEPLNRCDLRKYYIDIDCEDMRGRLYEPIDGFFWEWLDASKRNHLSVLGDYGTGKSSVCLHLAYQVAKRWQNSPQSVRVPIFVPLRDYGSALNVEQLITDLLVNKYHVRVSSFAAFRRLLEAGFLVLFLDGFDEMAARVDQQTTLRNFENLASLVTESSKTVLTCRTHYFRSHKHARELLGEKEKGTELLEQVRRRKNFEIVELREFDEAKIQAFLRKHTRNWRSCYKEIKRTYDLKDLAKRPILLEMIVRSLPELVRQRRRIQAVDLYGEYTNYWIAHDDWRSVMTPEGKALFMEELAFAMWQLRQDQVHFSRLRAPFIASHFKTEVMSVVDLDWFENDVRTCSFLNRDRDGNYRFIHRSFMDYFLAKRLVRCVLNEDLAAFKNSVVLHWEVFDFWLGLVKSDRQLYEDTTNTLSRNSARKDIGLAAIDCYVGLLFLEHESASSALEAAQHIEYDDEKARLAVAWLSRDLTDDFRKRFLRRAWFR